MRESAATLLSLLATSAALAQALSPAGPSSTTSNAIRSYAVAGDSIPESLTGAPGDAARGRAIVVNRQVGLCLLCHSGPFPEEPFQGNLAPDLSGTGSRWSAAQLRLRVVDASRLNPATIMPPYHRLDGLARVGTAWQARPILSARQVEDVVAFLATLRQQAKP